MTRFFKMVVGMFDVKRKKTEFATTNLQPRIIFYFVPREGSRSKRELFKTRYGD